MWKSYGGSCSRVRASPSRIRTSRRVPGDVIATIADAVERIDRIDNFTLMYNLGMGKVLMRCPQNEAKFEVYVAMPFTKGVTERSSGRTLLILGSNLHHIDAMEGQFEGAWKKRELQEIQKSYGNTIRWINIGSLSEGFIGLDFNRGASQTEGVATSMEDITFLARTLQEFGYDKNKRLFILKPPYVVESEEGRNLRGRGYHTLADYAKGVEGGIT